MTAETDIKCAVCGASTAVRVDAVNQRCEFCGAAFIYQATRAAYAEGEQRLRQRIAAIQPELDAIDAEAMRRASLGDIAGAHQIAYESIRRVAVLREETGYNRLAGLDTPALVERNLRFLFGMQLQRLGIPEPASPPAPTAAKPGYDQMARALQAQDFDGAIAGYTAMCTAQLDADPHWAERDPHERDQMLVSSVRSFALALPWASDGDYARHRIELPQLERRPDGTAAVTCTRCGAEVVLAHLAESVQCAYCSATFRVRLTGIDVYHASGHTDVTQDQVDDQQLAQAMARGDLGARVAFARKTVAGQAPAGSDRERELTFVYAMQIGVPLAAKQQADIATELGLGTPRTCKSCSSAIALAPSSIKCPMCTTKV